MRSGYSNVISSNNLNPPWGILYAYLLSTDKDLFILYSNAAALLLYRSFSTAIKLTLRTAPQVKIDAVNAEDGVEMTIRALQLTTT